MVIDMQTFYQKLRAGLFFVFVSSVAFGQGYESGAGKSDNPTFNWPEGKKMAISLTFDDARLSQVDKGMPVLDKYGVKATFYVSPDRVNQTNGWLEKGPCQWA